MSIHEFPTVFMERQNKQAKTDGLARRSFDVVVSGLALVALAPVMAVISIAVYLEGARPVFFEQTRLGLNGRPFQMYKFRKFRADCTTAGAPLTMDGDTRLTGIGKFLTSSKLDELPQLWNVFKGDMAIVGPRPESLFFVDCFQGGFEEILRHKPGLVGPSQVAFRHEAKLYPDHEDPAIFYRKVLFPAKANIDLAYFKSRTIGSDISMVLKSVLAILNIKPLRTAKYGKTKRELSQTVSADSLG